MIIYIIAILLLITIAVCIFGMKLKINRDKEIFLIIAFIILTFISGFRAIEVGTDTKSYIELFNRLLIGIKDTHNEYGYVIFNNLVGLFSKNPNAIIIATSIFINLGILSFIYYNSKNVWLSVYLYITMYYYFFSFNYVREFMAIALVVNSYYFLKKKKIFLFLLFITLAVSFHTTAIIGLLLYFAYWKSSNLKVIYLIFGISIVFLFKFDVIMSYFFQYFPRYNVYSGSYLDRSGGIMIIVLYFLIFITLVFFKSRSNNSEYNTMIIISCISAALSIIGYKHFIFVRPALYFYIFSIIIIPEIISRFKPKNRHLVLLLICVTSFMYMLYYFNNNWHNVLPYGFYFNSIN